ncbi:MAG: type III pantothenate kinase [Candidatus Omnitrophica bacterium]|nr:type III pantothenate kinase [Candidatus Omnitrophota bacterium]
MKLLCIDIGNTSTTYGIYERSRLSRVTYIRSDNIPYIVKKYCKNDDIFPFNYILITSVVPQITSKIRRYMSLCGCKERILVAGHELKVSIKHKYRSFNRLGTDRAVNAYGAIRLYGQPVLILDYGTAITCDYVNKNAVFEGGLIIPGPAISLKALSEQTALLPEVEFPRRIKKEILGRDTRSGMQLGILQGVAAMTDGLIERFRRKFGRRFKVVATGGYSSLIAPLTSRIDILDPLLTLKSLVELYKNEVLDRRP